MSKIPWVEFYRPKEFNNIVYMDVFRRTDEDVEYCNHSSTWYYETPRRDFHGKILGDECLSQAMLLGMTDYLVCKICGTSSGAMFFSKNIKDVYYV